MILKSRDYSQRNTIDRTLNWNHLYRTFLGRLEKPIADGTRAVREPSTRNACCSRSAAAYFPDSCRV